MILLTLLVVACAHSAYADSLSVVVRLKDSVSPPAITSSPDFGIASLDSIGNEFGIVSLEPFSPDPPGDASERGVFARLYSAYYPDTTNWDSLLTRYDADTNLSLCLMDTLSIELYSAPTDEYFQYQWMLDNDGSSGQHPGGSSALADIDAVEAWAFTAGSSEIIISVSDDGIFTAHPDLDSQLWENRAEIDGDGPDDPPDDDDENGYNDDYYGYDFVEMDGDPSINNPEPTEEAGQIHGTAVAGIAVASRNNSGTNTGVVGVAYDCKLMGVRLGAGGENRNAVRFAISAILYATGNGARVVSQSWGFAKDNLADLVFDAVEDGFADGDSILWVISSANGGIDPDPQESINKLAVNTPSGHEVFEDFRIVVGNGCYTGERTPSSSFVDPSWTGGPYLGPRQDVTVLAPGGHSSGSNCLHDTANKRFLWDNVTEYEGSNPGYWFHSFGGTSAAQPHVAGIAALLFSDDPELKASTAKLIIEQSAIDVTSDPAASATLTGPDVYSGYGYANAHRALLYPMVLEPAASETLWCGDTIDLEWRVPKTNTNKDTCDVYVSYDGGGTYTSIATDLVFTSYPGTYSWTVPEPTEDHIDEVFFKVIARHDEEGAGDSRYSVADTSDFAVTIRKSLSGTISADTTWAARAVVEGDLTIPSGKLLTVNPGSVIHFKEGDATSGGSDALKTELIVKGKLKVAGSTTSPVTLQSRESTPSEGDWYEISATTSSGVVELSHVTVRDAIYGLVAAGDTTIVDTCAFLANENQDLKLGDSPDVCTVTGCTITVGGGTGIDAQSGGNMVLLNNTIQCDSLTTNGILLEGPDATVTGNTIEDCTAGNAVYVYSGSPELTKNTIKDSKYGILVDGGSPDIG
ncbi:MAG: S8 family serine peptidase, partial [Rhodothermales bacterium]|nr:S8 family serine peptidase [Rhodothermales bacterium]